MLKCPHTHTVPWIYIPESVVFYGYYLALNQGGILLAAVSTVHLCSFCTTVAKKFKLFECYWCINFEIVC